MNAHKVAVLVKEFPFLTDVAENCPRQIDLFSPDVREIKIRRGDTNLLSRVGNHDEYSWCNGGHCDFDKYLAVQEGNVLALDSAGNSAFGDGHWAEWDAPSLGEQLFVKKIIPDFIVEVVQNDLDNNRCGEKTILISVFKMNRFDLVGYHQEQIDRAAAEIKAEIEAACVVPG